MPTENPVSGNRLIQIAEMLHASIEKPGAMMRELLAAGEAAFSQPSESLDYVKELIASQARDGADYIDVNLDALGVDTALLMREYLRLIHENGEGVPASIDSSNLEVLLAGLDAWFGFSEAAPPLVNSVPYTEIEKFQPLLDLRAKRPFSLICLLVGPEGPLPSTDAMVDAARAMSRKARAAGFRNDELFFDCVTLGIASDSCVSGGGEIKPSHTRLSFHAMRAICADPEMQGVHAVLGVSNWVYGAKKRRIGHIRAFISAAQRYGLDTAIVDVSKKFGIEPAPPELEEFVEMFVSLDGGEDSMIAYSAAMQNARAKGWL